jgi:hypothetical protein
VTSRPPSARDQDATPFSNILTELVEDSGAQCAALVDAEGETVDYAGRGDPFDIRILAAEWRIILQRVGEAKHLGASWEMVVRARRKSFLVEALPEGYALVMELARRASGASDRALCRARQRLCEEAGFPDVADPRGRWSKVAVEEEPGASRRPVRLTVEKEELDVTVLGRISDPEASRAQSFRVRLSTGEECTLVREPLGRWYLEEEAWAPPQRTR